MRCRAKTSRLCLNNALRRAHTTASINRMRLSVHCHAQDSPVVDQRKDISIILVEPQIPQNAGNVARTCAASRTPLALVAPTGFELDSSKLKRAGLDYWPYVCVNVHESWSQFLSSYDSRPAPKRLVAFSKFARRHYAVDGTYQAGDMLVYGAETHGLPDGAVGDIERRGGVLVKIPMDETYVRSLNLATSVGIGLFEAIRQIDRPHAGQAVAPQVDQLDHP